MDPQNIVVLENSRKYLTRNFIFPKKNDGYNLTKTWYGKNIVVNLISSLSLIGALLHLIVNIKRKTYINLDIDLTMILSIFGGFYFNAMYLLKLKNTIKLYRQLSDFHSYGIPADYENTNRILNGLSIGHYTFTSIIILLASLTPLQEYKICKQENILKNLNEICGLMGNMWFPFELDKYPNKQLFYLSQICTAFLILQTSALISFSIMETVEHIIVRLKHVGSFFVEALTEKNHLSSRIKFNKAVEYHVAVIGMANMANESFSQCTFVQILLTGAILGCVEKVITQRFSFLAMALFLGWAAAMIIVCIAGQRLMNESLAIGEVIWNLDWYNLDIRIQKDLVMVIMRCQKPFCLSANIFGYMEYNMIVAVLKASYSYLTLLSETS